MSTLCCRRLGFSVQGRTLLGPLDLSLGGEGISVVLGSNGAGKTVLLKLLHGLLKPSRGCVEWQGVRPPQTMVLQQPVMLKRSVADNLRIVPGADHARVQAGLAWAGLGELADKRADLLSPGVQQQLALARAWLCAPQWLFLDEPTASLDPRASERVEGMIRQFAGEGVRVVLSSHNLAQSRRLASDIVFLADGQAEIYPQPDAFFDAPASETARSFLRQQQG